MRLPALLTFLIVEAALSPSAVVADEDEGWTHFTCPPATTVTANGQVKFEFDLPPEWSPVLPPVQAEKWMATQLVSASLALLDGALHLTCTYATGGEMIARIEQVVPGAELKFSECIKQKPKHCSVKGGSRAYQGVEYACLVDVKSHPPRPETRMYQPFGVLSCPNPPSDESGCHFKCRN
jgi:hypothetical protein